MFNLTKTFKNENFKITPIYMGEKIVFIGKEVEEQLGYRSVADIVQKSNVFVEGHDFIVLRGRELEQFKEFINQTDVMRLVQCSALTLLTESGLYALILRSKKDFCVKIRLWITEEVLPEIRKTGGYKISKFKEIANDIEDIALIAKNLGLKGNNAVNAILKVIKYEHNIDLAKIMQLGLEVNKLTYFLNATDLGLKCSCISTATLVNKRLEILKLQEKNSKDEWELTEAGKEWGVEYDTGKQHTDGTPIRQIKWNPGVIKLLEVNS